MNKNRTEEHISTPNDQTCSPTDEGEGDLPLANMTWQALRWKAGTETPPFSASNLEVIHLLQGLVDGSADPPLASMSVSCAVAVQIWLLVFDNKAFSGEWTDVYIILASLALGRRIAPPDAAAISRLRCVLKLTGRRALDSID